MSCADANAVCMPQARQVMDNTIASLGSPIGASLTSRQDFSCAETSSGHSTDLRFKSDSMDSQALISYYQSTLAGLGWQLTSANTRDNSWVFTKPITTRDRLILTVSDDTIGRAYGISLSEQPAQ